jgi:uncharacterized membrane protein YphA (DoxX/SURF4 family)
VKNFENFFVTVSIRAPGCSTRCQREPQKRTRGNKENIEMAVNTTVHTVTRSATGLGQASTAGLSRRTNIALWVTQGALAAIFLFAGSGKLFGSAEAISEQSDFPVLFLRFIGACEFLGAIGLILPWSLRIRAGLTPLAAAGLVVIMVGATVTTAVTMSPALALIDIAIGAAAFAVVYGRRDYATRTK